MTRPTRLLIVGAGFWGATTALHAIDAGHDVTVLDDCNPRAASRNAAGMVHPEWYKHAHAGGDIYRIPERWTAGMVQDSVRWLEERWGAKPHGELFSSYTRPEWRMKPGLRTVHAPKRILTAVESRYAPVVRVERQDGGWVAHTSGGETYEARAIILCTGAWTDDILEASGYDRLGVKTLRGHAIVASGSLITDVPMTKYVAPYRHYTIRDWGERGLWRLGDTVEKTITDERARQMLTTLEDFGHEVLPDMAIREVLDGYRPVVPGRGMVVERLATGLVVATGGHRIGLGVAALAAREALEHIA